MMRFLEFLIPALALLALGTTQTGAQIIPSSRTTDWTQAGVPGGIPIRSTIFVNVLTTGNGSYKCAGDGVTDDSTHLFAAINACPSNQVVYIPAANYLLGSSYYSASKGGVTIRGDGPGKTILIDNGSFTFAFGQVCGAGNGANNYLAPSNRFTLYGSYTKGASNIVTTTANNGGVTLAVGYLVQISESNPPYATATGQNGSQTFTSLTGDGQHIINQMAQIVAINNGTNLTIWPPLNWNYDSSLGPILYLQDFKDYYVPTVPRCMGFENLTITNAGGSGTQHHLFDMYCPVQCWWTNVEIVNEKNYYGFFDDALQCQVDHCWFHTTSTNYTYYQNYDWETEFSTDCLFQNNIFDGFFEALQIDSGSCGNVVAYNLFTNFFNAAASGADAGRIAPGLSVSHGAYPMMNLVEGNVGMGIQGDYYWGSAGYDTLLRNRFTSVDRQWTTNALTDIIALKIDTSNLWFNVVGNILGSPNVSYSAWQMTGSQQYTYSVINRFGYPGIDSDGTPQDPQVQATMVYVANYDFYSNSIYASTNNVPNSLYLASRPGWFGNLTWPPFDPSSPTAASVTNIPAGYRYIYGVDPPSGQGVGQVLIPPPSNLAVIAQ